MKTLLEIGLIIGGWSLVALCLASFWIPAVLGWRSKLAVLPPLMRELWWTYACYVLGSHAFFALLCLKFGDWLLGGSAAAIAMSSFMLLWWSARLGLQLFGFDLSEIHGSPLKCLAKHLLTALFLGLVSLFAGLLCWNTGWLQ